MVNRSALLQAHPGTHWVRGRCQETYTCTFLSSTAEVASSAGNTSTERAAKPATNKATVVKKPKTAWTRLREECILVIFRRIYSVLSQGSKKERKGGEGDVNPFFLEES